MAINKSNSPAWVKVTLIVLIVAFVLSFITIVANPFAPSQGQTQTGTATNGAAQGVDAQYQPQVDSLTTQLQADPKNYAALVSLGNAYFDWAIAKEQASQGTTTSAAALAPLWLAAKDAYSRALEVKGDESPVRVDYAITVFYSGDSVTAIKIAEDVTKADPTFSPAFFNLGVFYGDTNPAKAIAAFQQYLKLDPKGAKGGNPEFAKTRIADLQKAGSSQGATGSVPATTP